MELLCGSRTLDLTVPHIMGILNTTPDSFSDGGRCFVDGRFSPDLAVKYAEQMVRDGASIIDIGGESTRPGAQPVPLEQERERVLPVVEALAGRVDAVLSIDTSSPEIMREAAALGAGIVNDVRALQKPGAIEAAAGIDMPVCLMHMQGLPETMQVNPRYEDVIGEVSGFLSDRIQACERAGIARERLMLDPGFGFGKSDEHNLMLLKHLKQLKAFKLPLLIGLSRKSMVGRLLNREMPERLPGSLGFALVALQQGANILRVHDVAATRDIVEVYKLTAD